MIINNDLINKFNSLKNNNEDKEEDNNLSSKINNYEKELNKIKNDINLDDEEKDNLISNLNDNNNLKFFNLTLYPTIKKFIDNHNDYVGIMGPVGSGKSSGIIIKMLKYSCCIRKQKDGVRRSRWVFVRNTKQQLKDTTLNTLKDWLNRLNLNNFYEYKEAEQKLLIQFNDVEIEILLRALDKPEDTRKLLSLECTGFYLNEVDQIDPDIFQKTTTRAGRYPSIDDGGCYFDEELAKDFGIDLSKSKRTKKGIKCSIVMFDTNPPDIGSYYHKIFENLMIKEIDGYDNMLNKTLLFYKQPSGDSVDAENIEYLEDNYYDKMKYSLSIDEYNKKVLNRYGESKVGQLIFKEFNEDIVKNFKYNKDKKLIIGIDFGLTPHCVVTQIVNKKLIVLNEINTEYGNKMSLHEFLKIKVEPFLKVNYNASKKDIIFIGDPAGKQRSQSTGVSCFDILKKYNYNYKLGLTNNFESRINAVKLLLLKNEKNEYDMYISSRCKKLLEGIKRQYIFIKNKNNDKEEAQSNDFTHIQDALQYVCMYFEKYKNNNFDIEINNIYNDYIIDDWNNSIGY